MTQYYFCFLDIECGSVETIVAANSLEHAKDLARIELGLGPEEEPIGGCTTDGDGFLFITT